MKKFWNVGKWIAVALMGTALLFAGCLGPTSEDSAIPAKSGEVGARYVYKFSVDPQQAKMDIEPVVMDTGVNATVYGGHTVDVSAPDCTWASPNLTCAVTVKNVSKSHYLTEFRTWHYRSNSSELPTLGTADFPNTYTTTVTSTVWVQPTARQMTDVTKAGMCYLHDGSWLNTNNNNTRQRGCRSYAIATFGAFNYQILHPDCGSQTETWTLGVATLPYQFYTALLKVGMSGAGGADTIAQGDPQWFPEKPFKVSGSTIVNNDDETRMDFTNISLFEIVPAHLDVACPFAGGCTNQGTACIATNNGTEGYKLGAAQCSTPYTDAQLVAMPAGTYFGINIGLEFPDRVESNGNHATLNGDTSVPDTCFEYMGWAQTLLSWDANVLGLLTTNKTVGGSYMQGASTAYYGFYGNLGADANYVNYMDTNHGFGAPVSQVGANFIYVDRIAGGSMAFSGGAPGCKPTVGNSASYNYVAGQPTNGYGSFGMVNWGNDGTNCTLTNQGVDSDVDLWLAMHYLYAKAAGGSLLRIETNNSHNSANWAHSNCSRAGGSTGTDDDIKAAGGWWCVPCHNSPAGTGVCACIGGAGTCGPGGFLSSAASCDGTAATTTNFVFGGVELVNLNITYGGPRALRTSGAYQAWNRHVCVQ